MAQSKLDEVVSLAKRRGFVFPAGEIYGGTRSAWDYGPLGVALKDNIKREWWRSMVVTRPDVVGVDTSIILPPEVWVASGHVSVFNDPLVECLNCHKRNRADKLEESYAEKHGDKPAGERHGRHRVPRLRHPRQVDRTARLQHDAAHPPRPGRGRELPALPASETAQGIFVDFKNVMTSSRKKPPFGIANMGKSFRNEITPGNFTFRTREFEQMECEFFCKPNTDLEWFAYWKDYCKNWLLSLGIKEENLRLRDHEPAELAFYSRATTDIEYAFPFTDWGELWGIADRTNYDLTRHQEASGKSLEYFDSETNEHYIPYVIEPSLGCDRVALAFLCEAYDEEHLTDSKGKEDVRTVLRLHPALAPYKCAVLPLSKKLGEKAMEIRNELSKYFMVDYDDTGSIGKRYRREDEIGTPFCITVDFDTVGDEAKGIAADNCVTVRDRDTMEQVRMPISELKSYIESKIEF